MRYCSDCGVGHDCDVQAAEGREDPAVAIARINAERDVKVAQLGVRQEREWNESREAIAEIEGDTAAEVAAAEAEVIGTILATEAGAGEPEPIVFDAPPVDVDVDQANDVEELPPADTMPAPETRKPRGLGMWG